jgi:DNA-binding MarR family transcriptional regulator
MLRGTTVDNWTTVQGQVSREEARNDHDFDPGVLSLTLTLYRALTAYDRAQAGELTPHGLTTSHLNILTVLHRVERPLSMGELGRAVSVRPANLTGVVDALTRRGLIERRVNPDDRRSYLVVTTEAGEAFLDDFLPGHWRTLKRLTCGLSRDDQAQLSSLLERFRESVEAAEAAERARTAPLAG